MSLEKTSGYTSGEHFASEIIGALEKTPLGVTKPLPLVFYLYLPDEAAARSCVAELQAIGLQVEVEESAMKDGKWLCLCKVTLVPEKETLTKIGTLLLKLAKEKNGELDGWETELQRRKGCLGFTVILIIGLATAFVYWLIKR